MLKVIPFKAHAGIAGFESPAAEYTQLSLDLDALLVDHPNATFIGLAKGDSMQAAGIFDGDLLIVDRAVKVQQFDVIVANLNGVFVCKRLDTKQRQLLSDPPGICSYALTQWDEFQVEGVVTRSVRLHRQLSQSIG